MSAKNPGLIYDASNSWNGYNHQGKVALFVAISTICNLWDEKITERENKDKLKNYFLEIEYLEDFAIGKINNEISEYMHIHQVKNRVDKNINSYEDALLGLVQHVIDIPTIENAFLHVTSDLNFSSNGFSEDLKNIVKTPNFISKAINEINLKRTDTFFRNELIKPKKGRPDNFKQQLLDAWHEGKSVKEKLTVTNLDDALNCLLKKLKGQEKQFKTLDDIIMKKIKIYNYPLCGGQNYCEVDKISYLLKDQIKSYYNTNPKHKSTYKALSDNFIIKSYLFMLGKLDQHIIDRDLNFIVYKNDGKDRKIYFSDILEWLDSSEIDDQGEIYYLSHIKDNIVGYMDSYCNKICKDSLLCKSDCKMELFKDELSNLDFTKIKRFLHYSNPHVSSRKIDVDSIADYSPRAGFYFPYAKGLRDIGKEFSFEDNAVIYENNEKQDCVLTTINKMGASDEAIEYICSEILKNNEIYNLMMECDYLISGDVEVPSIQSKELTPIKGFYSEMDYNHIMRCKDVHIISLENFINKNK